jgi:hypothetical protein
MILNREFEFGEVDDGQRMTLEKPGNNDKRMRKLEEILFKSFKLGFTTNLKLFQMFVFKPVLQRKSITRMCWHSTKLMKQETKEIIIS